MNRGARKAARDLFQAVVAVLAAGGATAVLDLVVGSVDPVVGVVMAFVFKILVSYAQNTLEAKGKIPVLLPSPGLVTTGDGPLLRRVVGQVVPVVQSTVRTNTATGTTAVSNVTGPVLDTAGKVVGAVGGAVTGLLGLEDLGGV